MSGISWNRKSAPLSNFRFEEIRVCKSDLLKSTKKDWKGFQSDRLYTKWQILKFIYPEKTNNFCEISKVDLSYVVTVKSTVEISQNFVAFSEYMNFTYF